MIYISNLFLLSMPHGREWFLVACFLIMYFIPSMIAVKTSNYTKIFILNFFLGWTLIGWGAALVWALISLHTTKKVVQL